MQQKFVIKLQHRWPAKKKTKRMFIERMNISHKKHVFYKFIHINNIL
jgi:hypothetical protein